MSTTTSAFRRIDPIYIVLVIGLLIGMAVLTHYGESWDELQFYKYADRALASYTAWPSTGQIPLTGNTYDNYGPAYVMLVALVARLLGTFVPLMTSDSRHLIYFVTYLIGLWAFYQLCKRWLSSTAALGACLLLATQPVFWGHAFISPKDVPFLTFFLLSLLLGFRMVDTVQRVSLEPTSRPPRRTLMLFTGLWLISSFGLLAATPLVQAATQNMVTAAAAGQSNIIAWLASDIHTANPEVYIQKYFVLFLRAQLAYLSVASLLLALLWRRAPSALRFMLSVTPAAIALGFTISIRVFGPFAGLLVCSYAIWKLRARAVPVLLAYGFLASIAMYLTWPYLWPDPIGHLFQSVRVMSEYPWRGLVLFDGVLYPSTDLPQSYLPVLLGIQLTEPVWLLFAVGVAIALFAALKGAVESRNLLILTTIWFVLPLAGFVLTRAPLYDNFRQVMFILPPVFMLAGVVFARIRQIVPQVALIALVILPGIVDGVGLHPYEYVYYNRLVGGVRQAFRKYELDYWGTSYREAAAYLNGVAPANASIWAEGPAHLLQLYARPDLKIYSTYEVERADHYAYVVALTRFNLDLQSFPDARIVSTVQRDGALLTVIKQP